MQKFSCLSYGTAVLYYLNIHNTCFTDEQIGIIYNPKAEKFVCGFVKPRAISVC